MTIHGEINLADLNSILKSIRLCNTCQLLQAEINQNAMNAEKYLQRFVLTKVLTFNLQKYGIVGVVCFYLNNEVVF